MNETIRNILDRRTIRSFGKQQVKDEDLELVLEAGKYAATARGLQPWHFTVIQNADMITKLTEACRSSILAGQMKEMIAIASKPEYSPFYHAPTVIIVSGDNNNKLASCDCANAVQNMAVAAYSLGLGSCYNTSFRMAFSSSESADLISKLGIPSDYTPLYCLSLGYQAGENPKPGPRKENCVTFVR